jgi:HEPN domain-containing protein
MQPGNVNELLEKAFDDLAGAEIMLHAGGPTWITGFHLQQAAEKLLKAVLISAGREPKQTHDLVALMQALEDFGIRIPAELEGIDILSPYAVVLRYETITISPEPDLRGLQM